MAPRALLTAAQDPGTRTHQRCQMAAAKHEPYPPCPDYMSQSEWQEWIDEQRARKKKAASSGNGKPAAATANGSAKEGEVSVGGIAKKITTLDSLDERFAILQAPGLAKHLYQPPRFPANSRHRPETAPCRRSRFNRGRLKRKAALHRSLQGLD